MRHSARLASAALLLTAATAGCEDPPTPVLSYSLNANIVEDEESTLHVEALADDKSAQAQLAGALEMLFGTPDAPAYLLTEDWVDEEYNPNYGGYDELSADEWDALVADNERAFASQLEGIERGHYDAVRVPREALDLKDQWKRFIADWVGLKAEVEAGTAEASELEALGEEMKEEARDSFALWYPTLRESAEMYRQQCWHCHGTEGGGNGSTADFLNPRPRDYRAGTFKFTALNNKSRPRRQDLYRILDEGIYGTAMPSFRRFSIAWLNGLVDYVRMLSIRGETEILLSTEYEEDFGGFPMASVEETYLDVWEKWDGAADEVIVYDGEVPPLTDESVAHGRELFMDAKSANCFSCHGPDGRGGGASAFEPVAMNAEIEAEVAAIDERLVAAKDHVGHIDADDKILLHAAQKKVDRLTKARFDLLNERVKDDWGNEIEPRDLTRGMYRFGRRPIDLFRRIYAGINGTPMPSHSSLKNPDGSRMLTDEDLWDIVHYVRSLSVREHVETASAGDSHGGGHDDGGDHGSDSHGL